MIDGAGNLCALDRLKVSGTGTRSDNLSPTHQFHCRVYNLLSDRCARKVSLVLEYLDMDLYRLMRSQPELLPTSPDLIKVHRGLGAGYEGRD